MPIYLQLTGGEQPITGDATQSEHVGWMDISSMNWNVSRSVSTTVGAAANREASEPNLSEVTLHKVSDSSHAALYQAATTGKQPMTATIDLVNTGNPGKVYCQYILQNTLVSGFSSGSDGDRPTETLTLNFTQKNVNYTKEDASGNPTVSRAMYSQVTAQASG